MITNSTHIFIWHYYLIQPIALGVLVLFVFSLICGFLSDVAKRKGRDHGFSEGYDRGFNDALRKVGATEELKRRQHAKNQ